MPPIHAFPRERPTRPCASVAPAASDLPPDIDGWPSVARWFLREITSFPSWKEGRWAHAGDEYLRERRGCRDARTIRRMRAMVLARGELARRRVVPGEILPDGERSRRAHWVYEPGPVMRRRLGLVVVADTPPPGPELSEQLSLFPTDLAPRPIGAKAAGAPEPVAAGDEHNAGRIVPDNRTISPANAEKLSTDPWVLKRSEDRYQPRTEPVPAERKETGERLHDERTPTSLCFSEDRTPARPDTLETSASHIAQHYARATGRRWRVIDPSIVTMLAPFLDQMRGSDEDKVARACAIVDQVVVECVVANGKPPTLRFVFHPQIFWRRLEKLTAAPRDAATTMPAIAKAAPRSPARAAANEGQPRGSPRAPAAANELPCPPSRATLQTAALADAQKHRATPPCGVPTEALQTLTSLGIVGAPRPSPRAPQPPSPDGPLAEGLAALRVAARGARLRMGLTADPAIAKTA